jgi:RHS repeat-associated protein
VPEGGPIKATRPSARLFLTLALCGAASIALAQKEKVELALTAPANGAVYTAPASVPLSALARAALLPAAAAEQAISNPQAIAQVEFFAGALLLGTVSGPQPDNHYAFTWTNPAAGVYSISARASNGKGDSALSGTISIIINAPPTVSLSSPVPVVTAPGTITLSAAPLDSDGSIQKVDFFRGTTLVGTATAAPFSAQLQNLAAGTYAFTARATDNHGATGESGAVTVIVNDPPSVALAAPPAVVTAPGTIALVASPTDADGTIQKVDFFRGTTLLGTATASPYSLGLADIPAGSYTYTALATDNHGAIASSNAVTVIVNDPPKVVLTSPSTVVTAPGTVSLAASPTDSDGGIQKVDFFRGTTLIGTATASPYNLDLAGLPAGTYTFTAVATDNHTATGSSAALTVRVNAPPTITLTSTSTSFRAPADIPLSALAFDLDGTIAKVELFNGPDLIATLTAEPFSATWAQVPQGTYTLTAVVTDDLGASVASSPVAINVTAAQAKLYFVHVDHLNTPLLIADEVKRVVWRRDNQEPFGADMPNQDPSGLGRFNMPLRFPGQYYDDETSTAYNYHRNFDATRGQYLQSDPVGLWGGPNTFAYAYSDPLKFTDPFGLAVYLCTRAARGLPGNHSYFYSTSGTGQSCGMGGMFGRGSVGRGEFGLAADSCVLIPGSQGVEDLLMNCCYETANKGPWIPYLNDCYQAVEYCLEAAGFPNPGFSGTRLAAQNSKCSACDPLPKTNLFMGAP